MHNEGNPVIHKVRGAEDNPSDMRMLGIEFLNPGGGQGLAPAGTMSLKVDYEDDTVRVFRLRFPADLPRMKEPLGFMGVVIGLKGAVTIEASSPESPEPSPHELTEGDLVWNDGARQFSFAVPDRSESEALLILMK
jgi:hypothetical protein